MISSVCSFGIFVRTEKLFEGLIPVELLFSRRDTAVYNEMTMTLRAGSRIYRLGDPIRVRVARAEVATGRIDLEPSEVIAEEKAPPAQKRHGRSHGGEKKSFGGKRGESSKRSGHGEHRGKRPGSDRRGGGRRGNPKGNRRAK